MAYGPLIGHALKRHGSFGVDQDRARDLALKALADLIERPEQFDPAKGGSPRAMKVRQRVVKSPFGF